MADGGFFKLTLGPCWRLAGHDRLEVGIAHLIGVEFGAVGRQVEHLDSVLGQPRFDRLGVVQFDRMDLG